MQANPSNPDPSSLGSRFQQLTELGRGGMGVVYRAFDPALGRAVAVKTVLAAGTPGRLERFEREGQITAALTHPGIVRVHATGVAEGRPYLVYELIEGARTLEEVLPTLELRQRLELLRDVASALGYAHERGVVHRDVKPENVLVDAGGSPRVADFGLANAGGLERLTQTGALVGTPSYMSPEQLQGRADVGPPADVWALGVMLYQAASGGLPFQAESLMQLVALVSDHEPPPPHTDRALNAICAQALAKDPRARYADGWALARELEAYLAGDAVSASQAGVLSRAARRVGPWPLLALAAVALALVLLLALGPKPSTPPPGSPPATPESPAPPPPAPTDPAADPAWVTLGNRELADAGRLPEPDDRRRALEAWLEAFAGHPRTADAHDARSRLRREYPLRELRHAESRRVQAAFLPDGRALTWSGDGQLALWALEQDAPLRRWTEPGLRQVVRGRARAVLLGVDWLGSLTDGERVERVALEPQDWQQAALTPDEQRLLAGTREGLVVELDAASGARLRTFSGLRDTGVMALAVSPDGTRLVASDQRAPGPDTPFGGEAIRVQLWDLVSGQPLAGFQSPTVCLQIAFTSDSQAFVSGLTNGQVLCWDRDGRFLDRFDPPAGETTPWVDGTDYGIRNPHGQPVWGLGLSPAGDRLYTCSDWTDGALPGLYLRTWSVATRTSLARVIREESPREHRGLRVSPDGRRLLLETMDGVAQVWAAD